MLIDQKVGTRLIEATGKLSKQDEVTLAEFDFGNINIAAGRTALAILLQLIQCTSAAIQIHCCDYNCWLQNFIIKVGSYVLSFVSFKTAL